MTEKYEELNRLIQERLDRGTTLVYTQTGYLRNDQPMILTVVSNRELMRLNQLDTGDRPTCIYDHWKCK